MRLVWMIAFAFLASTACVGAAPECFTRPPAIGASVITGVAPDPACDLLAKLLPTLEPKDLSWMSGRGVNAALGLTTAAFPDESYVLHFRMTTAANAVFAGKDELVRFALDEPRARGGSWWVPLETVETADEKLRALPAIAEILALPPVSIPKVVAYASHVNEGTVGYFGVIAPAFGHAGGGMQFWFPSEPVISNQVTPL